MKGMLDVGEVLILSYGLGIYRLVSPTLLKKESETLAYMGFSELEHLGEGVHIGITNVVHLPSKLEIQTHDTDEFLKDRAMVMGLDNQKIKDRFYELHKIVYGVK